MTLVQMLMIAAAGMLVLAVAVGVVEWRDRRHAPQLEGEGADWQWPELPTQGHTARQLYPEDRP
jgi:hypothetical protein